MNNKDKNTSSSRDSNRDPITHEPGSHPVGVGVGAAAGGVAGAAAAGAAAGTLAGGPVGAGVGAAVGAVAGGVGGHAVAEKMNPTARDLERFVDYRVVDRDNNKVGSVDAVWADHSGEPAYLGVRTGWLGMGKAHVVPAWSVHVSEGTRKLRLPYSVEEVKNAPSFADQGEIDAAAEDRIAQYYASFGYAAEQSERQGGGIAMAERTESEGDIRMSLAREELKVGKRQVEAGGIRLRKIVRTETVNQPVELQREEIVVERVPAGDRAPTRADIAFREEEVFVPLRREEAVIEKTLRATEEVRVAKKQRSERRDIQETVRREDVDVQKEGEAGRVDRDRDM